MHRIQDPVSRSVSVPVYKRRVDAQIMDFTPAFAAFTRARKGRHDLARIARIALSYGSSRGLAGFTDRRGMDRARSQDTVMTRVTGNVACRK